MSVHSHLLGEIKTYKIPGVVVYELVSPALRRHGQEALEFQGSLLHKHYLKNKTTTADHVGQHPVECRGLSDGGFMATVVLNQRADCCQSRDHRLQRPQIKHRQASRFVQYNFKDNVWIQKSVLWFWKPSCNGQTQRRANGVAEIPQLIDKARAEDPESPWNPGPITTS